MFAEAFFFLIFSVLALSQNVTITTQDSRMHFDGSWTVQESGVYEFTTTIGSSVSLVFPGTAIYWHATINPRCGIGNVSIDGDFGVLVDASIGSQNNTATPAILFSQTGLQPGVSHSINITFFAHGSLGGPYMEMYNLSYTQDNTATSTTTSNPISTSLISSSGPSASTSHKSSTGTIAGGVIGGLFGIILVLGCVLFLARRNLNKTKPLEPPPSPYTVERPDDTRTAFKSAPVGAPTTYLPSGSLQPQSQQLTSEPTPTDADTPLFLHPSSSPLTPNRNEPALSVAEDPPPPYIHGRNETSN